MQANVLYLGISGVLHPSVSLYELIHERTPWSDGHRNYEAVPWLAQALDSWPDLRIVLTSTMPWKYGLQGLLPLLGPLAARVDSHTYSDLTERAKRTVRKPDGSTRELGYSCKDYWRMHKSNIVAAHVAWSKPARWLAVDDEDILWPQNVRRDHVVVVDGCRGLLHDAVAQDGLLTVLHMLGGSE
jgi:hypothetical protein